VIARRAAELDPKKMLAIAAEMKHSETAFPLPAQDPKAALHLRWFTPANGIAPSHRMPLPSCPAACVPTCLNDTQSSAAFHASTGIIPTAEPSAKEGLINVRDFSVKGEAALDRVAAGGPAGAPNGVSFSRLRAEFTRQNGQLIIREGVVKGPTVGATIEGSIDYPGNQVRMSGTFVPMYGLNNMFGQIPIVGLFLGGGSNEGLIGITYEVVGSPGQPVLRVNPISAIFPGVSRKIMEFNTGKQNNPVEFPPNN